MLVQKSFDGLENIVPHPIHVAEHATPHAFLAAQGSMNARAAAHVMQCDVTPNVAPQSSQRAAPGTGSAL
jgi:hypothetical protein